MKRVLFVIPSMHIGGTRSSLLNLLNYLVVENLCIDLIILSPFGEYLDQINPKIHVISTSKTSKYVYSRRCDLSIIEKIVSLGWSIIHRIIGTWLLSNIVSVSYRSSTHNKNYDAIIAFQEGDSINFSSCIPAKRHFCWIHNNVEDIGEKNIGLASAFSLMNGIFFVSQTARQSFVNRFPLLKEKTDIVFNIIDEYSIKKKANEYIQDGYVASNSLKIVSVGRFVKQKAFHRIIPIAKRLREEKIDFQWIIIGDGEDRRKVDSQIIAESLEENILTIGNKKNPYPYIATADLLTVTSLYESQPMVILEALILGIPVLTTRFHSAHDLLDGKKYAIICENSLEGLEDGVFKAINSLDKMKQEASFFQYDNRQIIDTILKLFEGDTYAS